VRSEKAAGRIIDPLLFLQVAGLSVSSVLLQPLTTGRT